MTTDTTIVDVSEDWALASNVQQRFMRPADTIIRALSYSARCRQVRELGGDCYDVLPLPNNCVGLAIGDASGKSLPAALMISSVQSSLRTAATLAGNDAARVLQTVNGHVYASSLEGRYATLFYGVFDGNTHTLRYVNAGHNPPIVVRRDHSTEALETGGVPVGMFPGRAYDEGIIQLHPGDLVVACTDGVTEVLNQEGAEWGAEGLQNAINGTDAQSPDNIVSSIFASMDEFSNGCQTDDATILVARVH